MNQSCPIYGAQPVLEALRSPATIEFVCLARRPGRQTDRVRQAALERSVPVRDLSTEQLTKLVGSDGHQGVGAMLSSESLRGVELEELLERIEGPPLLLLLDHIQDPQNLGAVLRSAHALGAQGVVIPFRRAAQMSPAVIRASAGAALHVPVAGVGNIKRAISVLRDHGVWMVAASTGGPSVHGADLTGPLALVIGGEARGVRPSVERQCDGSVSIPMSFGFESLNASVAAAILLYEVGRQRARGG